MIGTMIGYIEGTIRAMRPNHLLVVTGGIGYKVFCTKETIARFDTGDAAAFYTHLAVREDALDLFGFADEEELRFFDLLLSVSGIGPKSALSILDTASVETIKSAVVTGNANYLTGVSGIGKKTAEKIVLELKDKVAPGDGAIANSADIEALEAMRSLGYSAQEAREALRSVGAEFESASERLREALRVVGNRTTA